MHEEVMEQRAAKRLKRTHMHPLAGFVGMARRRRVKGRRRQFTRRKSRGRSKARVYASRQRRIARTTRKKIALEVDVPLTKNILEDSSQDIIGGATALHQVWNTIGQGIQQTQRIGERCRRTGLWIMTEFFRGLPQVGGEFNHWVRVIFARQKGHGAFPTNGTASGQFPQWPLANQCFTREWHREYRLLKDVKVHFGIRPGFAADAQVRKQKVFKFKFNYPMIFHDQAADADMGRIYMYCVCPQTVPADATDLTVTIKQYCNYFVDQFA